MAAAFLRVALASLVVLIFAGQGEAAAKNTLVCEVEQTLLFADNPSDFPNGPAYFSLFPEIHGKIQIHSNTQGDDFLTNPEIQIINAARSFIKENRGASFTVDTTNGSLTSIPFGKDKFKVIDQTAWDVIPRILSPANVPFSRETYFYIGYWSNSINNYYAILTIDSQIIGTTVFRYSDLGGMLFGNCY